jgi:O-antigen ligase
MSKSITYALGLIFFMLAWLSNDHYRPWLNFHSEMLAFAGLFSLLTSVLIRSQCLVFVPRISFFIILVVLVPWLQFAVGISFFAGDALLSSLYLSGLLAGVFVGFSYSYPEARHQKLGLLGLMHCLWLAALVSAAIGLLQWLNLQDSLGNYVVQTDIGERAKGNLGQPNQLATLLLMGMAAYAFVYEQRVIGRLAFFLGIALMTGVLVLAQSRAGMLSVVLVTVFLIWKKRTVKLRLSSSAVAWWAVCFFIGTLALPYLSEALLLGDVRGVTSTEAISQRWRMWQQVGYAMMQSPWVGYGWNQTPTAHAAGAIAFPGDFTYTNAHNFVLDLLVWNGLPLGLLLSGSIAYWFFTRIQAISCVNAVLAMACLLPFAVHSMLEFPFAYAYFLITAGFMVGVVEAAMVPARTIDIKVSWIWCFGALLVSLGSYLTYEYFLIEEDFRIVRFESLRVGQTADTYEIPHVWMISHMGVMLKAARQVAEPNMKKADLENLRKVALRFPYGAVNFRYALALALNADPVGASHQMAVIRGMFGETYYMACKAELQRLEKEKYPQFADVVPF